jgi:opacity protein-like surface antigen
MQTKTHKTAGLLLMLMLFNSMAWSGTVGTTETDAITHVWSTPDTIYMTLRAGGSISEKASVVAPLTYWDLAPEGYNDNVGHSQVLGASVGYVISPLFQFEMGLDNRSSFKYKKHQSAPSFTLSDFDWGPRIRAFEINNTTVMSSLFVNGSGMPSPIAYKGKTYTIDPFIGVGIGVACNGLDKLHSLQSNPPYRAFSVMTSEHTTQEFAYQFMAGFDIKTNRKIAIGFSYRYLDAGAFQSSNHLSDNSNTTTLSSGTAVPAWSGKLRINEVYATLKYALS